MVLNATPTGNNINAGTGDDMIIAGAGKDVIQGGAGNDTVSYAISDFAVTVDATNEETKDGYADGDELFSVENIIGSRFDDTLIGSDVANTLEGGKADTIDGGNGDDTASYASSAEGVNVVNLKMQPPLVVMLKATPSTVLRICIAGFRACGQFNG